MILGKQLTSIYLFSFLHQPVMILVKVTVLVRDPRVVLNVLKDITRLKMRAVKVIWLFSAVSSLSVWNLK